MFYLLGTVFQTAILVMFIIPRLRPGITTKKKRAVWKTVPTQSDFSCSSLRDDHKCSKSITDNADATDLFFSRISFNLVLPLDI